MIVIQNHCYLVHPLLPKKPYEYEAYQSLLLPHQPFPIRNLHSFLDAIPFQSFIGIHLKTHILEKIYGWLIKMFLIRDQRCYKVLDLLEADNQNLQSDDTDKRRVGGGE